MVKRATRRCLTNGLLSQACGSMPSREMSSREGREAEVGGLKPEVRHRSSDLRPPTSDLRPPLSFATFATFATFARHFGTFEPGSWEQESPNVFRHFF